MDHCLGLKPRGFPVLESLEVGVSKVIQDWNCKSWTSGFVTIFRLLPSFDQSWSLWPNDQHWRGNIYLHHIYIFFSEGLKPPTTYIYINRYPLPCLITGWESMFSWCNSHLAIGKSSFFLNLFRYMFKAWSSYHHSVHVKIPRTYDWWDLWKMSPSMTSWWWSLLFWSEKSWLKLVKAG